MASPALAALLPLLLLSFFFHPSSTSLTIHVSENRINTICKKTLNFEFCKTTLDHNSRTHKAGMNELGIITVLSATAQARLNKFVVDQLLRNENDPIMKDRLTNCFSDYTVTQGKLQGAYRLSDMKDYKGMIKLVNDAMKMSTKCENRFRKPPARPSPLAEYNQEMVWFNDIALVVLDMLDK